MSKGVVGRTSSFSAMRAARARIMAGLAVAGAEGVSSAAQERPCADDSGSGDSSGCCAAGSMSSRRLGIDSPTAALCTHPHS